MTYTAEPATHACGACGACDGTGIYRYGCGLCSGTGMGQYDGSSCSMSPSLGAGLLSARLCFAATKEP